MSTWDNAINREFVQALISDIETLKNEHEDEDMNSKARSQYYAEIGRMVCSELFQSFDKDLEL